MHPDDDPLIEHYWHALERLQQPAWRKLLDPGVMRFMERRVARRAPDPIRRRVPLFFGASMEVVLPEVVSEQIHSYGLFDDVVTWLALCAIEPDDVVYDVGAHFGYFSLLFAALSLPSGRVYSFEPTPSTFEVLASNVAQNPRIKAINAAAGAVAGRLPIADYGVKYSAWNTLDQTGRLGQGSGVMPPVKIEVEVVTLDEFAAASGCPPAFIKIDAENFEPEVLRGAERLLATSRPALLLEAGSARAAELAGSLVRSGYRAFSTHAAGTLLELNDAADAALHCKDVLFVAGERADRLLQRAQAFARTRGHGRARNRAAQ
jgi:FkbM family methyltransferase